MRIAPLIALAALAFACADDDVTLELSISLGSCEVADLSDINFLTVEVWGYESDGRACALSARCIPVPETMTSLDDLHQVLQDVRQPLTDTPLSGSVLLYLKGHTTTNCLKGNNVSICALGSIDSGGVFELPLKCQACDTEMDVNICIDPMEL